MVGEIEKHYWKVVHPKSLCRMLRKAGYNTWLLCRKLLLYCVNIYYIEFNLQINVKARLYSSGPLSYLLTKSNTICVLAIKVARYKRRTMTSNVSILENLILIIKYGSGSIMVWACMAAIWCVRSLWIVWSN